MDADNLHRRLKKIIGQLGAIDKMVDQDVPCEDMLMQINAAKSALHKDRTIAEFAKAIEHFSRMS